MSELIRTGYTPYNIMIKPAGSLCNLDCRYCYYLDKADLFVNGIRQNHDKNFWENFVQNYISTQSSTNVSFVWQGGEPALMGLDFYKWIVEIQKKHAGNKKIENVFQTNGTLLNREWCSFLAENKFLVGISVDGPQNLHDIFRYNKQGKSSFKEVMNSIELLRKCNVDFNTLTTVNSLNVKYPLEVYQFLKEIGSQFLQFMPVVERISGLDKKNRPTILHPNDGDNLSVTEWSVNSLDYGKFLNSVFDQWVKKDVGKIYVQMFDVTLANWYGENPGLCVFSKHCGDNLIMEHQGNLYQCDHFVFKENYLGKFPENDLLEAAKSVEQITFGLNKEKLLPGECRDCEFLFACHGECPKNRIIRSKTGEPGLNYLCEGLKLFFQHVKPSMDYMLNELKNQRPPANIMKTFKTIAPPPPFANHKAAKVKVGRNELCPCGSGKFYKNCCRNK